MFSITIPKNFSDKSINTCESSHLKGTRQIYVEVDSLNTTSVTLPHLFSIKKVHSVKKKCCISRVRTIASAASTIPISCPKSGNHQAPIRLHKPPLPTTVTTAPCVLPQCHPPTLKPLHVSSRITNSRAFYKDVLRKQTHGTSVTKAAWNQKQCHWRLKQNQSK